jgi:dTDP-6-deoxy-L-talose 4-dehydrogenase (NAD+)
MKVVVTGASGFIGRYVLRELARRDDLDIVAVSRRPMQASDLPEQARSITLDLAAPPQEGSMDRLGRPDVVIHLAWAGLPNYKSLHHFEEHLAQQYRFLGRLVKDGLRSLTCTGTCFEYGMRSGALSEDMVANPSNPYGFAKHALHRQLHFLQERTPFELNWCRLFYMYGVGQPASSLYSQFATAVQNGDRSFAMSGGEQLRDFLPVTEVARLLVSLALDAPGRGTLNICSGRPVSVRSLVEGWRRDCGSDIELDLGRYPYPDYEPFAFWGSDGALRQALPPSSLTSRP